MSLIEANVIIKKEPGLASDHVIKTEIGDNNTITIKKELDHTHYTMDHIEVKQEATVYIKTERIDSQYEDPTMYNVEIKKEKVEELTLYPHISTVEVKPEPFDPQDEGTMYDVEIKQELVETQPQHSQGINSVTEYNAPWVKVREEKAAYRRRMRERKGIQTEWRRNALRYEAVYPQIGNDHYESVMKQAGDNPLNITEGTIQMEVVTDQPGRQTQRNIQSTETRSSNAERQRRYREKRKADKMNASGESNQVQPQREQLQHDVQINKSRPQSNAERQRKYRQLLREQQQQMGVKVLRSMDPAECARKRHLNKQRQRRFRARQRMGLLSTFSHRARAESDDQDERARKRHLNKQRQCRFRARQRMESHGTRSHQAESEIHTPSIDSLNDMKETRSNIHVSDQSIVRGAFFCDLCDKTYAKKNTLKRHQLVHTNERPYVCNVCDKGFTRSDYLKRHQLVHAKRHY